MGNIAEKLGGTGLLINFGSDRITGQIGTGGIDVGGAVYDLIKRGIDKAALEKYAESDADKGTIAMKNYIYGDWTAENTSMRLAGQLDELRFVEEIRNSKGEMAVALTTSQGNGRLIQMVNSGNANVNAVRLNHESYRDGIIGSGQTEETLNAVIAHTMMADKMYRNGADFGGDENIMRDLYELSKGMSAFKEYAMSSYDSSADYWLTKIDGTVEGTPGDPRMWREVMNDNGEIIKELIPGSMEKGSQAASLFSLFGEDRLLQRLGLTAENAMNINNYDDQTLKDVFGWDDDQIKKARSDGVTLTADDVQRRQLLGEAMLKQNGYVWDDSKNTWSGSSINISDVPVYDNVGIIKKGENYLPFALNTMIYRDADAHKLYTYDSEAGKWNLNEAYKDNTDVFVYRRDLITGETQRYEFAGPLNFADNLDGKEYGANQAYEHPNLGTIQGATVAAGRMNMRISYSSNYGEVLLFSNFTDLKGDYFGANGMRAGLSSDLRTLYHATVNGFSDSCLVSYTDGKSGKDYFNDNMNYLKNIFGLYRGYSIKTSLVDWNRNATPGGGVRAKGYKE